MDRPRLVSPGEYVAVKAKCAAKAIGGLILTASGGLVTMACAAIILGLATYTYLTIAHGQDCMTIPPFYTISAILLLCVPVVVGVTAVRHGVNTIKAVAGGPRVDLMTREAVALLPIEETLVRASDRPADADGGALMRPAADSIFARSDESLRAAADGTEPNTQVTS